VCDIEVEPLPSGGGFEFVDKVVGGSVPRQFIPSVEKGVRTQMERGVAAGYPVVDLRVTLYDGKSHSVDSSDMAFQTAGALALKEAARSTEVHMLEPVDEVSVLVADEYVGAVMGDLSTRRGRVTGTEPIGRGRSLIKADVPQVEVTRYAVDLRSISHGTGTFSRRYLRHEPMPAHVAAWEQAHGRIPAGAWVLLRTGWSTRESATAFLNVKDDGPHSPGFHASTSALLANERDILGVGGETVGTDAGRAVGFTPPFPNHTTMHGAGKFGLASLRNLDQLPPTGAIVIAAPLKLANGSGSPLRVLAIAP
jgi:kynurenine formamidase